MDKRYAVPYTTIALLGDSLHMLFKWRLIENVDESNAKYSLKRCNCSTPFTSRCFDSDLSTKEKEFHTTKTPQASSDPHEKPKTYKIGNTHFPNAGAGQATSLRGDPRAAPNTFGLPNVAPRFQGRKKPRRKKCQTPGTCDVETFRVQNEQTRPFSRLSTTPKPHPTSSRRNSFSIQRPRAAKLVLFHHES